jgi:hypothetical protein
MKSNMELKSSIQLIFEDNNDFEYNEFKKIWYSDFELEYSCLTLSGYSEYDYAILNRLLQIDYWCGVEVNFSKYDYKVFGNEIINNEPRIKLYFEGPNCLIKAIHEDLKTILKVRSNEN